MGVVARDAMNDTGSGMREPGKLAFERHPVAVSTVQPDEGQHVRVGDQAGAIARC